MESANTWIAMLLAVALVGLLARIVSIPYPILLVAAGLGIGLAPGLHPPPLDPNLILLFFLPVLLYNEAFHTSWLDFSRWLRPIVMLAVGLVGVTIFAVGVVLKLLLPELPWAAAFVLGAIVSPTDTVAANAVLQRLRVPRRLSAVLGGESLVNDATGLVALQLGIGVILSGAFSWWELGRDFTWTVAGGVAVGLLAGIVVHEANRRIRDTTILFTISLIAPFVAFSGAHSLHASGVLAVVVAGFFVSWRFHTVAADTRYELYTVWRLLAYIVDAVCFLLIGIEIPRLMRTVGQDALPHYLVAGGLVTIAVILVRILWMFPAAYLPLWLFPKLRAREGGYPPTNNVFLAAWCGIRGAVSLAAALSIPILANGEPFPGRDALIICTFCVIIGTLIIQGLSLQPLIRLLGIRDDSDADEQSRLAQIAMIGAALIRLGELRAVPGVDAEAVDHVEAVYMERLRILIGAPAHGFALGDTTGPTGGIFEIELEAIHAERQRLLSLRDSADVNDMIHDHLQEELDVSEMRAKAHHSLPAVK